MSDETESPEGSAEGAELEQKATSMGWQPKENWKGNPDNWVDAAEFVKRGETFVPFLQHQRKRLQSDLDAEKQARQRIERELAETRASVEDLKKFSESMAQERQERRKVEIGQELKVAREAGDDVRVAELQNDLATAVKKPDPPAPKPNGAPPQPEILPWVKSYVDGDADFFQNTRKVALFNAIAIEKRRAGDARVGETDGVAFLNEVKDEVNRSLGGNPARRSAAKTEESRPAGGECPAGPGRTRPRCRRRSPRGCPPGSPAPAGRRIRPPRWRSGCGPSGRRSAVPSGSWCLG